jgi:hypothetical protein
LKPTTDWRHEKELTVIDILSMNGVKDLLLKATPAERGLFLLLGYAANQVNVLWKLLDVMTNETPENPIEQPIAPARAERSKRRVPIRARKCQLGVVDL